MMSTGISDKSRVMAAVESVLLDSGFTIESKDWERPWGGFFVIQESEAEKFIQQFFPAEEAGKLINGKRVSPKILVVAPGKRLSWQYHHRRSEIWRLIQGTAGVVTSNDDIPGPLLVLKTGDKVVLKKGERHRLVGLEGYGMVAEIWQHTDPENPSDELDIVRLQDDFGRE